MTGTDHATLSHATSRDGTQIGYFTCGAGPPLLLVHGAISDHTRWEPLVPHLEPHVTVHAMDRRGRGASGDAPDYAIEREHEDVAAVVDAIAQATGSGVAVYCSSFGGQCAFGAPALTSNIARLALYEAWPPVHNPEAWAGPPDVLERLEALLAAGDREAVVEMTYRELLGLGEEELAAVRAQPSWPSRVAAAHTVPREIRVTAAAAFNPDQAARIPCPRCCSWGQRRLSTAWPRSHPRPWLPHCRTRGSSSSTARSTSRTCSPLSSSPSSCSRSCTRSAEARRLHLGGSRG